jgi:8-oxo-dGTP diphosphatase
MAIAINRRGIAFLEYKPVPESELASDIYKPMRFTFVVIRHNQDFLLVHHRQRQTWELPGGHIEAGESARDCAIRELFEETGQRVDSLDFRAVLKYRSESENRFYYGTLYAGQLPSPAPFHENEEISQITFWDGNKSIGYIDDIDAAVINLIQTGSI